MVELVVGGSVCKNTRSVTNLTEGASGEEFADIINEADRTKVFKAFSFSKQDNG